MSFIVKHSSVTVSPAYGRDYKSKAAVLADWNANKDFRMEGSHSGYINKADAERYNVPEVNVRYNKLRDFLKVHPS